MGWRENMDQMQEQSGPEDLHEEDMANVGSALMEALSDYREHPCIKGWAPADCPTEIVGDLLNVIDERTAYIAAQSADLSQLKQEISLLRDAVVTYGDRARMGTVHNMALQQAIDRAFDREG